MRGFIYIIEVAIAGLLIALALGSFLATSTVRQHWSRSDLIALGDSAFYTLAANDSLPGLLAGTGQLEALLPFNVQWALHVAGTPKPIINIGCIGDAAACGALGSQLTDSWLNGRWIKFSVAQLPDFDPATLRGFDVLVFLEPADFDTNATIQGFLAGGGKLVAVFDIPDTATFDSMDSTFNLSMVTPFSSPFATFMDYDPAISAIPKYFLGIGMDVPAPGGTGWWTIWQDSRQVNISSGRVKVENKTTSEGAIDVAEGDSFVLEGAGTSYSFRVKKLWPNKVIFQPLDAKFGFINFALPTTATEPAVSGLNVVVEEPGIAGAVVANRTAVWISAFPADSSEYRLLVKAAAAAAATDWWIKKPVSPKQAVTVNAFTGLCCDVPETIEFVLWLWYAF